jgi:DNA-binding SARP family transcriptional activator/pimeloyl-ACP methyl ester carboxylesterase
MPTDQILQQAGIPTAGAVRIKVLGDFAVTRDGVAVDLPQSKKTRALLAYLAVTEATVQRQRLCEIFWDMPDDPRGALRWSLSKIRQVLGEDAGGALTADRNAVCLKLKSHLDYAPVARLSARELPAAATDELEEAAGAICGPFLADLSLDRCEEFEFWRRSMANDLEILETRILRELISRFRSDPERCLIHAQRLHVLHPDDTAALKDVDELRQAARRAALEIDRTAAPAPMSRTPREPREESKGRFERDRAIRFCKARDGVRLAYSISGEGSPIVRAAHWMSHLKYDWDSPIWKHWIASLSAEHTLVRYDERCNGLSSWDAEDISFDAMVSDLEHVVEAAHLDRFTLLGISQGCAMSIAYTVRHPERVSGLILYGGYDRGWRARGNANEIATREALATLMREGWGKSNPLFRQLFSSMFIRGAGPEHFAWMDELQRTTMTPENAWRLQNAFAEIDVTALLPLVKVPTLILHARDDAVAPVECGRTFALEIPDATFMELDSPNHILLEGEPAFAEFMEHVTAFIAATAP